MLITQGKGRFKCMLTSSKTRSSHLPDSIAVCEQVTCTYALVNALTVLESLP